MAEVGKVIDKKGELLIIQFERTEACGKCGACIDGMNNKDMFIEASNACNAKVGDRVTISLEKNHFLLAIFIMYIIPLISLLVGLVLGYLIFNNELISLAVGVTAMSGTFLFIKKRESSIDKSKYRPIADQIITD